MKAVFASTVVLGLLAAGCGGGGTESSGEDYAAALDAICRDRDSEIESLGGLPGDVASVNERADKVARAIERAAGKAERLSPPEELQDAANRFVAAEEGRARAIRSEVDTPPGDLPERVQRAGSENSKAQNAAREIGAKVCAGSS